MPRSKKLCSAIPLLAAAVPALVAACGGAPAPIVAEGAPRRPDGVAIDLPSQPPRARGEAQASDGVVALVTPLGTDVARAVVQRFFGAITTEDRSVLGELLSASAKTYNPTTGEENDANYFWNRRFDTFDYTPLGAQTIFRKDAVEVFRIDQWDRSAQPSTASSNASDVVARVRIPAIASSKPILGESIALQLRRVGSTYVIVRLTEDFSFQ